jgi:hypothetical protein
MIYMEDQNITFKHCKELPPSTGARGKNTVMKKVPKNIIFMYKMFMDSNSNGNGIDNMTVAIA